MGGVHKGKGLVAQGKKRAAALKKAGKGIFKVKTLSADLAAITGRNKMNYPDTFKAVWAFIKKKKRRKKKKAKKKKKRRKKKKGKRVIYGKGGRKKGVHKG